jgi:hypothetical protein
MGMYIFVIHVSTFFVGLFICALLSAQFITNSGAAHCKLSPSQERENEQIQNQIDAHLFF